MDAAGGDGGVGARGDFVPDVDPDVVALVAVAPASDDAGGGERARVVAAGGDGGVGAVGDVILVVVGLGVEAPALGVPVGGDSARVVVAGGHGGEPRAVVGVDLPVVEVVGAPGVGVARVLYIKEVVLALPVVAPASDVACGGYGARAAVASGDACGCCRGLGLGLVCDCDRVVIVYGVEEVNSFGGPRKHVSALRERSEHRVQAIQDTPK